VSPRRIVDTRIGHGAPLQPIPSKGELVIQVGGTPGVPATGVAAVVLNVTVTQTTAQGFVTLYPTGGGRPVVSNLNIGGRGETSANLVTVAADSAGRVTAYALTSTHLVVDVAGYYTEELYSADGRFEPIIPTRILDTRSGLGAPAAIVPANTSIDLDVVGSLAVPPDGVSAVVVNLTGTQALADGHVTVWPTGQPQPLASNLNLQRGGTRANLVVVPIGTDGKVSIYTHGGAHLIADVAGCSRSPGNARSSPLATQPMRSTRAHRRLHSATPSSHPVR